MRVSCSRWLFVLSVLAAGGCGDKPSAGTPAPAPADVEAEVRANLARLGPDDQREAERQRYCPMMEGVRLGELGPPHKVTVGGVPAFVCCANCARAAEREPDKALAKVKELEQARAAPRAP